MYRTLLLPLAVLVSAALPGQDEAKVLNSFKKAFAAAKAKAKKPGATPADRHAALQSTDGLDSGKLTQLLVRSWHVVNEELAALDGERAAIRRELTEINAKKDAQNRLPRNLFLRVKELQPKLGQLRAETDGTRAMLVEVGDRIAALRRRDSVLFLLKKVCGHKKAPLPLKLAAAKAVGASANKVLPELAAAMTRARQPAEQIVLLDAMALAGQQARLHATPVIKLLACEHPAVAERAALALAKLAVPAGIER